MKTLRDQKEAIFALIDRGGWKHSWHLPTDAQGYHDWSSPAMAERIMELVQEAKEEATALLIQASEIDLMHAVKIIEDAKRDALQEDAQR